MKGLLDLSLLLAPFITVTLGLILTWPEECRAGRWSKIVISIPAAMVITQSVAQVKWGYFGVFMILFLAHVWKGNIAWLSAWVVTNMITTASDTIVPDFRRAKMEYRDGNLAEALQLAEKELSKDPRDVEGLLFVAQLLIANQQYEKALSALDRVRTSKISTTAQVARAESNAAEINEVMAVRIQFAQQLS